MNTRSGPLFLGMWSSVLGAVELYLLSCKFVFIHVAFHFEIYVANKVVIGLPLLQDDAICVCLRAPLVTVDASSLC